MSRETPDVYSQRAKKEGYPARSVYKLAEIQEKFYIFSCSSRVLDIGCAPGSWSAYILRHLSSKGFLVGIDLKPVIISYSSSKAIFLEGDMMNFKQQIKELGVYDAVVSDIAPRTTGNRIVDTGRSLSLVEEVVTLAFDVLKRNGNFAIKIFQGGDEGKFEENLKPFFNRVKRIRPKAVRRRSFETYLVGIGFKGKGR